MSILFIPKEIYTSFLDLSTIQSFCSSCKEYWNEKELISQHLLHSHLKNTSMDMFTLTRIVKQNLTLPLTFYQFATLLDNQTYFHILNPIIETFTPFFCKMGVPFRVEYIKENLFVRRITCNGITIVYPKDYPKITIVYKEITREEKNLASQLDNLCNLCPCSSQGLSSVFTREMLLYVKAMVLYKQSAEDIPFLIKKEFPIFPSPKKLFRNEIQIENYSAFFHILFNDKKVVKTYFDFLKDKHIYDLLDFFSERLRFFYFVYYYGNETDLAYQTLKTFKEPKSNLLFNYISDKHDRYERSYQNLYHYW